MDKDELSQRIVETSPSEWPGAWRSLSVPLERLPDHVRAAVNARIQQAIREKRRKRWWIAGGMGSGLLAAAAALVLYVNLGRSAPSENAAMSAVVLFAAGDVRTQTRALTTGDILRDHETLSVGEGSLCDIQIREAESAMSIRVRSGTQASFSARKSREKTFFIVKVNSGTLAARVQKLGPRESVEFVTPTSVASVRGTKVEIEVAGDGTIKAAVYEGKVHLRLRLPEIDDLPPEVLSESEKLGKIVDTLEKNGVSLDAGQSGTVSAAAVNTLRENPTIKVIIESPDLKQVRDKKQPTKAEIEKAVKSADAALSGTKAEALASSVQESVKAGIAQQALTKPEMDAKLKEIDELLDIEIGRLRDALRAAEAAKERNQQLRDVLMARIEAVLGKPAETVVLTDGTRLRGVVIRVGDMYHVVNAEGRKEVPVGQVDRIEFE